MFGLVSDDDFEDGRVYESELGLEMERRKAHLAALPGAAFKEDLEALNRASYVTGTNGNELVKHVTAFVESGRHVNDLPDQYLNELVRLLHNYLTSVSSLIDAQRVVIRHRWPDKTDRERIRFQADYDTHRRNTFASGEAEFMTNLRNYCTHYAIPVPGLGTSISWSNGGPVVQLNTLQLEREKLLRWSNWSGPAKSYLTEQDERFDFAPIIERYSTATRKFYGWFWDQMNNAAAADKEELQEKGMELYLWHEDVGFTPTWIRDGSDGPPPGWNGRRERAENRRKRFEHGSRGYVKHVVTASGDVSVTRDPWPPLPLR